MVWLNVELISKMIYQGQHRRGLAYTNIWKQLMFIASKKETKMQISRNTDEHNLNIKCKIVIVF